MDPKITRFFALILVFALLAGISPLPAAAAEVPVAETATVQKSQVNPLYEDVLTEEVLEQLKQNASQVQNSAQTSMTDSAVVYDNVEDAGAYMRQCLVERQAQIVIPYAITDPSEGVPLFDEIFEEALKHTGNPKEGDTLKWQWAYWNMNASYVSGGYVNITCDMTYYTTAAQEKVVDQEVARLLEELNMDGMSDYEKVCTIYDYLCHNVDYDHENLNDTSYTLKFTAYAALVNKTAVCQGYALLLYRLAMEEDIGCRLIFGIGGGGNHSWNIIKLGDYYYNADATWDEDAESYSYFLVSDDNFPDHYRDDSYATEAFYEEYPMSSTDFDPDSYDEDAESCIAQGSCGANAKWVLSEDNVLTISGTGAMNDYESFNTPWYLYSDQINRVVIEDGIATIGYGAFYGCYNVTEVSIPDSVTVIEDWAFAGCESLETVNISAYVLSIGLDSFYGCSSADGFWVDENNFYYASDDYGVLFNKDMTLLMDAPGKLSGSYNIPESVETIDSFAFTALNYLTNIYIYGDVINIGECFAAYCNSLEGIWVVESNRNYCSDEYGVLYHHDGGKKTSLVQAPAQLSGSYTIADGIEYIHMSAFEGCDQLTSVAMPDTVTNIGAYAFNFCENLTEITLSQNLSYIPEQAFCGCYFLESINIPDDIASIGPNAFAFCESIRELVIPKSVASIDDGAFREMYSLEKITFLGDAPAFSESAFEYTETTACYPAGNSTWTSDVRLDYGGTVNWTTCSAEEEDKEDEEPHVHEYIDCFTLVPTCTKPGYNGCDCVCGDRYIEEYFEPSGHRYDDDTCLFCGASRQGAIRVAGSNRFETAFAVADQLKDTLGVDKFDTVIIASGANFADALAGSYLASEKNAPILLAYNETYNNLAKDYIYENLNPGGTIYILGGYSAVAKSFENGLKDYNVVRMNGSNRFETNLMILREAGVNPGDEILVCTSTNFADSLSASATGMPILLVYNEGGKLFSNQIEYLETLSGNSFTILGGTGAVSEKLESILGEYGTTSRLAGSNRFETSVLVAETYFDTPETAVFAYAWNYPDGLCGGSLAAAIGAPLILTMTKYESAATEYISETGIEFGYVLGSEKLIANSSIDLILSNDPHIHKHYKTTIEPTDTEQGYDLYSCYCGDSYKLNFVDKPFDNDLSAETVYQRMIAKKKDYPEGMHWTNDDFYQWKGGYYYGGYGCAGFAFILSDAAFGDLPARFIYSDISIDTVRVGDILRVNGDSHSVVVMEIHDNYVVLAEGNYGSSIHWGRTLTAAEVAAADYIITRYPE